MAGCVLAGCVLAGCGGAQRERGPERVLRQYVAAISSGDAQAAYELLDEETRATVSLEDFRALLSENQRELSDQLSDVEQNLVAGIVPEARVRTSAGLSVLLQHEEGRWRLAGGVLDAPVLRNPRDAVLALRWALERRSLHGIERVLARPLRAEIEAEIERLLADTEDELDLDYQIRGNRATVRTSSGREILLIREAGEWRVLDFH